MKWISEVLSPGAFQELVRAIVRTAIYPRALHPSLSTAAWEAGLERHRFQSPNARSRDYLSMPYVTSLVREHSEGIRDHGTRLWTLLAFEVWLQLIAGRTWDNRLVQHTRGERRAGHDIRSATVATPRTDL